MKRRTKETNLELLPFRVGVNEYAIDVLQVREIRPSAQITPIAADHPRIRGAIDVRGVLVPVIDLRERDETQPPLGEALVIIVAVARRLVGIVVDAVCDIVELVPWQIQFFTVPDIGDLIAARMAHVHSTSTGGSA